MGKPAICNNKKCDRKETCERYNKDILALYNMEQACYNSKYKWYIEKKIEIEKVEEWYEKVKRVVEIKV